MYFLRILWGDLGNEFLETRTHSPFLDLQNATELSRKNRICVNYKIN